MPQKILIVDDDPQVLEFLETLLAKKGNEVGKAMDGAQAMEKDMRLKPDLNILDIMMPAGSGDNVYTRLKQSFNTKISRFFFSPRFPSTRRGKSFRRWTRSLS